MTKLARILRSAFLSLFCLSVWHQAIGQNPHGTIRGSVQDASGGRVAGANIVLQNTELSFVRETRSDGRGEFQWEDLPPGSYSLTVNATGFADAHQSEVFD